MYQAEKAAGYYFTNAELLQLWQNLVDLGGIDINSSVLRPTLVLRWSYSFAGLKGQSAYLDTNPMGAVGSIIVRWSLENRDKTHYVSGDGFGAIDWDPYPWNNPANFTNRYPMGAVRWYVH